MTRNEIIEICKTTTSERMGALYCLLLQAHRSDGLLPFPEASGSSRAAFGKTGWTQSEIDLADCMYANQLAYEVAEGADSLWGDVTDEAFDEFDGTYNDYTFIECIAKLPRE